MGSGYRIFTKANSLSFYEVCHHLQAKPLPQQGIIASFEPDVELYTFYWVKYSNCLSQLWPLYLCLPSISLAAFFYIKWFFEKTVDFTLAREARKACLEPLAILARALFRWCGPNTIQHIRTVFSAIAYSGIATLILNLQHNMRNNQCRFQNEWLLRTSSSSY